MPEYLTEADLIQTPQQDFLTEADLVAPVAKGKVKKVAPKKPTKPTLGDMKKQAGAFSTPFAQTQAQEGYEFKVEGTPSQVELKVKPLTDLDYKKPMFELGRTKAEPAKLKPVKARPRPDESPEEFAVREAQFEDYKQKSKIADMAARAETRRKTTPKLGLEKYPIAMAEGVENVLRPLASVAEQASGTGTDYFAYYNQMPRIGEEEAKGWDVKYAQAAGSIIPYGIASALGGLPATVIMGAASNSAQTYEEAKMRGASEDKALAAAVPGAVIGSLEGLFGLGTGRFMKEIGKGSLKTLFGGVAEEELQELTTQALNNVNAKWLSGYDPQRALTEGLWETFVLTLGLSGGLHGIGAATGAMARRGLPKVQAEETLSTFPSFRQEEMRAMEDRATVAGRPIALTPERLAEYQTRNTELKQQLLTVDPASPEFARLSDEYIQLARAIDDAPTRPLEGIEDLRQHLLEKNLGHEAAAQEMLDLLQPVQAKTGLEFDSEKFERSRQSDLRGARFYPLDSNPTKGGTVYLTPQTFEDVGLVDKGQRSQIGAINVSLDDAWNSAALVQETDPAAAAALIGAVKEAEAKGLPKVSIVAYAEGQGLVETRKLMRHESFHTGQEAAAGGTDALGIDPRNLHPREILYHSALDKVARTKEGQSILNYYQGDPDSLALEIAAYSSAGQHDYIGLTPEDAATYLTDYLTGIAEEHGPEALDRLAGSARLRPKVEAQVKGIANEYRTKQQQLGSANRSFADLLRGKPLASGRSEGPEGRSSGGEGLVEGGVGQDADTATSGGMDQGPPTDSGVGADTGQPPNIYTTVLSSDAVKDIANKAGQVLKVLGIPENPLLRPHEQIMQALKDYPDRATPEAIGAAMRQLGMDGKDLVAAVDEASAHAGRLLRNLQDANAKWSKSIKDDPKWATEAAKTGAHVLGLGPSPKEVLKAGLASLEASELGRTWWQRAGDMYRKALLTMFSTAANNAISTVPRLPLDLIDGVMTGAVMGVLNPKKYAGKSDATIAEAAREGAIAGAQATMRVAMAFPDLARKLFRKPTPESDVNDLIISQMESLHPELHTKLTGLSSGLEVLKESKAKIEDLKSLLPYLNDAEKMKEYEARLNILQKRYDANQSMLGKAFNKTGWVYDQFMKPSTVQEFFFRRPYFVGSLVKRAKDAGFDLYNLIENTKRVQDFSKDPTGQDVNEVINLRTLADLPPEVWEGAADDALTFTYAYAPKKDKGVIENLYATYIESIQKLGLAGAIIDAFPKATYNGLKFAYEYSPLGAIKPSINIAADLREGGRTAVQADDVSRMVKAGLGMAMFGTAIYIRKEHGGEEWYQIKTGRKDKKGQPIYLNVKKYMPFAGMLYLADLTLRMQEGRMFEVKTHKDDLAELYLNARRADSGGAAFFDITKEMLDWVDTGAPIKDKTKAAAARPLANVLGAPLTPLVNLRDMMAQFDEDEAARRDQKGSPILGPAIDKIPWLRSSEKYGLPLFQPPTEQAPRASSEEPAATLVGVKLDPGSNFATREFARLGLSPIRWLKPDPDPIINRAQYAAYSKKLAAIAPKIEASPLYQNKTDTQKAAFWEAKLGGPDGIAAEARELGKQANPKEINKREILQSQPPLIRKATGLDKKVNSMKNASDK